MKRITNSLLCLSLLWLLVACDEVAQAPLTDYAVVTDDAPMSERELSACFRALGLRYERFTCMLPERTRVSFSAVEYVDGQERKTQSTGTLGVDAGKQDFLLFQKDEGDYIRFTVSSTNASVSCGTASVERNRGSTNAWIQIEELKSEKQPIYIYATNEGGISGITLPVEDIEEVVSEYDYAMVIYASLKKQ